MWRRVFALRLGCGVGFCAGRGLFLLTGLSDHFLDVAFLIFLFERLTFVVLFLTSCEGYFDLDFALLQATYQRNQSYTLRV